MQGGTPRPVRAVAGDAAGGTGGALGGRAAGARPLVGARRTRGAQRARRSSCTSPRHRRAAAAAVALWPAPWRGPSSDARAWSPPCPIPSPPRSGIARHLHRARAGTADAGAAGRRAVDHRWRRAHGRVAAHATEAGAPGARGAGLPPGPRRAPATHRRSATARSAQHWSSAPSALDLSTQVTFAGGLPRARVLDLLCRADLMLFPAEGEGFGLVAAEALMRGVPVVSCWDGGGVLDVVPEQGAGRLVIPSGEAIADAALGTAAGPRKRPSWRGERGPSGGISSRRRASRRSARAGTARHCAVSSIWKVVRMALGALLVALALRRGDRRPREGPRRRARGDRGRRARPDRRPVRAGSSRPRSRRARKCS